MVSKLTIQTLEKEMNTHNHEAIAKNPFQLPQQSKALWMDWLLAPIGTAEVMPSPQYPGSPRQESKKNFYSEWS